MIKQAPSRGAILAAVAFAFSCFCLILFFWVQFGGSVPLKAQGYRFQVSFGEAPNLAKNADVRISGVSVGRVVRVSRFGQRTDATVELQARHAPIPADTRAVVRAKTLLGEAYVELSPGSRRARRLDDGGRLPARQVATTQAFDQVLSAFDERTRESLKRFVGELSVAVDGRGQDLNFALGNAGPTVENLERVVGVLDYQQGEVGRLVRDTGTVLAALGRREGDLQRLVTAGNDVLSTTASRNRELTETVRVLPGFLRDLRGSLEGLETAGAKVAPDVRTLRRLAPEVRTSLVALDELSPQFESFFNELRPVMRAARTGLPAATSIFEESVPLFRVIYPASRELRPIVSYFRAQRTAITSSLAKAAAATQATTDRPGGRRHYLRTLLPITNENLVGFSRRLPSNRHNPYLRPEGLADFQNGGLRAFDCANTGNPATLPTVGSAPPCRASGPWSFGGAERAFPHVERGPP